MANKPPKDPAQGSGASRRDRLRQEQEKQAREQRMRTRITIAVVGVAVLALVGVVVWVAALAINGNKDTASSGGTAGGGNYTLTVGDASAPVTVDIYQDFMCPYCGQFERANGTDLKDLVESKTAKLVIHPMAFLDDSSQGTKYSTRAANALVTVAKNEPDKVLAFNAVLYANQPDENTVGLTDSQIGDYARSVGVSDATVTIFAQKKYTDFVASATQAAFDEGIQSTPTVKLNGTKFDGNLITAGPLKTAIEKLAVK